MSMTKGFYASQTLYVAASKIIYHMKSRSKLITEQVIKWNGFGFYNAVMHIKRWKWNALLLLVLKKQSDRGLYSFL